MDGPLPDHSLPDDAAPGLRFRVVFPRLLPLLSEI